MLTPLIDADDVILLRGAKSGGGSAPKMTKVEAEAIGKQTDIADWQWQLAQEQQANQNAMMPYYLKELGYELSDYTGTGPKFSSGGQDYTISEIYDPTKETNKQIEQVASARALKALKGELDVDPAVKQDLDRQRETLHEELQRRLGPGYANSDAGMRALSEFDRNANLVNYGVRHGELSAAQAVQMTAADATQRRAGQKMAGVQGYAHFPGSAANTAQGGAAGYGQISSQLGGQRMNEYGVNQQGRAAQSQMWGQLAGGGLTAAAGIGFAV